MPTTLPTGDMLVMLAVLATAFAFKPWLPLSHRPLQMPWLGAMTLLPFVWWTEHLLPNGMALHVTGTFLLILMVGWPLAMWSLLPIGFAAALIGQAQLPEIGQILQHIVWRGMIPGTLGLLIGLGVRTWVVQHMFVYILGRAFMTTAVAVSISGVLAWITGQKPDTLSTEEWMLAHWLLGWAEAISTGMLTSIFVAFKPEWLLTYSDERYLPRKPGTK